MTFLTPELMSYLLPIVTAIIGYLLRHYHIEIPGLPKSPNPLTPAVPAIPADANHLLEILKLLEQIKNPTAPGAPVQALNVSTPTHDVQVGADGTKVTAK